MPGFFLGPAEVILNPVDLCARNSYLGNNAESGFIIDNIDDGADTTAIQLYGWINGEN